MSIRSVVCVHRQFERSWPYTADHWHNRWQLNDELALAADVFAEEPLPLNSPLLGRHNVVHTPHAAGRTRDANAFADDAIARFRPR